jgi:hypothetical protein
MVTYRDVHEQLARAMPMLAGGGFWVPREVLSRFLDSILQTPQGQRLKLAGTRRSERARAADPGFSAREPGQ